MSYFIDMVFYLQQIGVADVLLPFLLVFTIVFAVMAKTKILGSAKKAKRYNLIVALVLGFAVIMPHVLLGTLNDPTDARLVNGYVDIVEVINLSLPQVSIVVVAIVMLLLLLGVFGIRWKAEDGGGGSLLVIIAIIVVVYIFGTSAGWFFGGRFPNWLRFLDDPQTQALIVTLVVFFIVIWLITREDKDGDDRKGFWEGIGNAFPVEKLDD